MKKIIYSFLTLSLILSGSLAVSSCSSSDDSTPAKVDPTPDDDNTPQTQELVVTASATTAYLGETITLSATFDGQAVTTGVVYYVDDVAISGNTITSDVTAEMLISAKYQNVTSEYVSVAFVENPFIGVEGQGSFTYNGTTVQLDGALLEAINVFPDNNGGYTVWWIQYGWSGNNPSMADNYVAVSFDTPALVENGSLVSFELPDANQNIYYSIEGVLLEGVVKVGEQFTGGSGTVTYTDLDLESNPATANFNISVTGTHNIGFSYSGDVSPVASARARMVNGNKHNLQIKSLEDKEVVRQALIKKFLKK